MRVLRAVCVPLAVAALLAAGSAQDAVTKVQAEIQRLQQSLKDNPITEGDPAEVASMAASTLKSAAEAHSAGRFYLSLEKLGQGEDLLEGARAGVDKAHLAKSDFAAFDSEWGAASLRLTALDKEAHQRQWDGVPLVVRALSEAAQGKAIPLLEGSRGFAAANGPKDGLLYMGEADGEATFSKFCASLNLTAKSKPFPLRSFLPELQSIQARTNAAFQPPKSIDLHPRFIALNSAIKLGQELDSSRFYAGALYQYLEAVRHYAMLDAPPLDAAQQARLKDDLANARQKVAASADDDSLVQLFLERADSQIAHADGSAPSADEWRSSRIILDQVLPAYYAARKPATPMKKSSGRTVDITLVRWPYT